MPNASLGVRPRPLALDERLRAQVAQPPEDAEVDIEALTALAGKPVELPEEEQSRPHGDALEWHRKHVFVGDAA